jgi:4-hydroxybenzoate polyprenyltransferase
MTGGYESDGTSAIYLRENETRDGGQSAQSPAKSLPLAVDLDGALIRTDVLVESIFALLRRNSLYIFLLAFWLIKGKAYLKRQVSLRVTLDVETLPYNRQLIEYLRDERGRGRLLILAAGADELVAQRVADHLRLFDRVLASDGAVNMTGAQKRERLKREFGEKGFDYAGDAGGDLAVWSSAQRAILVNCTARLSRRAARVVEIERAFNDTGKGVMPYMHALRPHHWLKNLLVFVPLTFAYRMTDLHLVAKDCLAFLAFGLCASSVYLINDLADIPADRRHPRKRERPFAAGELSLVCGLGLIPLLLGLSILVSLSLPRPFLGMLVIYFLLNLGYSFTIKRIVLLDVIVLAGLYTMRIMAGSAAVSIWPTSWLLAFSTFLFLSLALVKRYAELVIMGAETNVAEVRGYQIVDKELIAAMGSASGYVAVLVLAIYISSGIAEIHYERYQLIWFLCPLLLYWISYVWLIAHRGGMHDDPLVFTVRDKVSRIVMILAAIVLAVAR